MGVIKDKISFEAPLTLSTFHTPTQWYGVYSGSAQDYAGATFITTPSQSSAQINMSNGNGTFKSTVTFPFS